MISINDKIMQYMKAKGRGKWVCNPRDFSSFGSRAAVNQALSRLVQSSDLRRIGQGFYDLPRINTQSKCWEPADLDLIIAALERRDTVRIMDDGLIAANRLGLTTTVATKLSYVTNGASRTLKIDGHTLHLRHAGSRVMVWANKKSGFVVQALRWLGPTLASEQWVADTLQRELPNHVKKDLIRNSIELPRWAAAIVDKLRLSDE